MLGKQITAEELYTALQQKTLDGIIVDVRSPAEFAKGAIAGAINIPVDQITLQTDLLKPHKNVYFYCLSGGRSELALAQLVDSSLSPELYNLTSGLLAWRKNGYPLTQ